MTRVGRGTPMGELLRRYWFPVAASVGARGRRGPAGPAPRRGPGALPHHRRRTRAARRALPASRRLARLRRRRRRLAALRLPRLALRPRRRLPRDAVAAASSSRRCASARGPRAYRAQELGGLVFAYLGPEPAPLLPRYDLFVWTGRAARHRPRARPLQLAPDHGEQRRPDPSRVAPRPPPRRGAPGARGCPRRARYGRRHVEIGFDVFRARHRQAARPRGRQPRRRRLARSATRWSSRSWCGSAPGRQHRFQIRVPVDDTHTLHFWYSCYLPRDGAPRAGPGGDPGLRGAVPRRARARSCSTSSTAATS